MGRWGSFEASLDKKIKTLVYQCVIGLQTWDVSSVYTDPPYPPTIAHGVCVWCVWICLLIWATHATHICKSWERPSSWRTRYPPTNSSVYYQPTDGTQHSLLHTHHSLYCTVANRLSLSRTDSLDCGLDRDCLQVKLMHSTITLSSLWTRTCSIQLMGCEGCSVTCYL